jgi:copper chaperone NosL
MKSTWLWLILVVLLLAGCAPGVAEISPPEIHYGEDVCAACNMIISEPRFAAAYAYEIAPGRYQQLAFDDIGDMLLHAAEHPEHKIVGTYVHDYETEEWLDAAAAYFIASDAIVTPMGYGIAAFATEAAAQAQAQTSHGDFLTWSALQARKPDASMHTHSDRDTMHQHGTN